MTRPRTRQELLEVLQEVFTELFSRYYDGAVSLKLQANLHHDGSGIQYQLTVSEFLPRCAPMACPGYKLKDE